MKRAMLLSLIIFLITVTSTLSSELPLEGGYFKWLLHLGQSPSDRIHNAYGHGSIDGNPNLRPTPGQIMDFGDERYVGQGHPATHDMMIWTPQYSTTGYFADEGYDEWFTQYYHIYIHSPSERLARLRFRKYETLIIRNNGEQICDVRGFDWDQERFADFTLCAGVNSMTFKLMGPPDGSSERSHLAVRITDHNDAEFSDLTYSLEPPLPDADVRVSRTLPSEYDPGSSLDVTLKVDVKAYVEPNELTIIEYIPERVTVLDANGGRIVHNTLWWTLSEDMGGSTELHYTLAVPPDYAGVMPFIGYLFYDKTFVDILGDKVLFENQPISPADVPDGIETIEIYPEDYTQAKDVTVGGTSAHDYSGSLEDFAGGLVTGLKPYQTGGWAEYEFSVPYEGEYQIVLDYGELWTMFHHAADVNVVIDGELHLHTQLYPTTHCYGCCYTTSPVSWPPFDPERKAKWTIDIVKLSEGQHLLRVVFPAMYPAEQKLDRFTDGRPVLTRIILINYPGLILTDIAEPHHLDSYEHAPARLVHDRAVVQLPDGRVEMTFYGAFYSLSQGNELYFADTSVHPRSGESDAKFEVVAIEPKVFHLPPQGEQDFSLVVRSKEPVAEDYSEMVVVWLQGVPSSPSRKPYLFTTARRFVDLLPYEPQPFSWRSGPLLGFGYYGMGNDLLSGDIQDPADSFIPDRHDLGLSMGRYRCDVAQFFEQQVWTGRLPSAAEVIEKSGGVIGQSPSTWGQFWSAFLARTYWRDNTEQAKEFVQRLSENLVFYPVTRRWDWARPEYLPQFMHTDFVRGMAALQPHVRTAQEGMVSDTEQFKILHNMVLPIFNSYWDELRTIAVLTEDANEGDTTLCVDRPAYGQTGCPTDGFNMFIPAYVRIEGEPYPLRYSTGSNVMELTRPLSRAYSKGTRITSWAFIEEIELEAREVCSLAPYPVSEFRRFHVL